MTITGWILFAMFAAIIVVIGIGATTFVADINKALAVIPVVLTCAAVGGLLFGMLWYFGNTASGKRAMVDQRSNLNNGLEREITVYTADGREIAHYEGKIDISSADGYVKFDFNGKRYIYYNCFVECIAEVGGDADD